MGFWDSLKAAFGLDSPIPRHVSHQLRRYATARHAFTLGEIADEVAGAAGTSNAIDRVTILTEVERQVGAAWMLREGYVLDGARLVPSEKKGRPAGSGSSAPASPVSQNPLPRTAATAPTSSSPKPVSYDTRAILGATPEELRRRALKINPYRTAFIGRVDLIPPQSDERTALIDRGLLLRGFLNEAQLEAIHRIGDLWLEHKDQASHLQAVGRVAGDAAVLADREERAKLKAEKKAQAERRAQEHAAAVAKRRAEQIDFLGRGVSGGLHDHRSNVESLEKQGLPVLSSPPELARALGLEVKDLRWLAFHAQATERPHYVYFEIPKRSGGTRLLAAPHRDLAKAQAWILEHVLSKLPTEAPAHGFIPGRSTVTNAEPHLRRDIVVNQDLSDFFPTITFPRVRGVFEKLGYSPSISTVLALLCTESPRRKVEFQGRTTWAATGPRGLPQGACTSPALSNQVARKLDRRLAAMCAKHGFSYTRYADDLTFSADKGHRAAVPMLLARVRHVVEDEGFVIHPTKGRVQRAAGRQLVTGIVVNERPGLPREEVRKLRAILHGAAKTGLAAQNRTNHPYFEAWLRGKIAYLMMVDRARGTELMRRLDALG